MKKLLAFGFLFSSVQSFSQNLDSVQIKKISDDIMLNGKCYENLRVLTKTIGHRLSGSPEAEKAVLWGKQALIEAGADSVWLQPVEVPFWIRGKESLKIKFPGKGFENIKMLSLGNTEGTNGKTISAEIICVNSLEEFDLLPEEKVRGKIIFFNYKFRQDFIQTFNGYGDAVKYRSQTVNRASRKNALAVIIRAVSTGEDDEPHTGSSRYEKDVKKIPIVAVGNYSADRIFAECAKGKLIAKLNSNCGMKGTKQSFNVVGQINGTVNKNQFLLVGGHLDSWDVGEGAHDDGAGCVQSIEVIRTFRALDIRPKNSVRAVLFMNEENGVRGGTQYANLAKQKNEKHLMAIESDAGGFSPRGIGLVMDESKKKIIQSWANLFLPYGVYDFSLEEDGTDISPLKNQSVPLAGLLPDSQRYFDVHHSANDVFEAVNHRELKIGATVLAAFIYLCDKNF